MQLAPFGVEVSAHSRRPARCGIHLQRAAGMLVRRPATYAEQTTTGAY